jgi:Putative peptidoglycan binding domain
MAILRGRRGLGVVAAGFALWAGVALSAQNAPAPAAGDPVFDAQKAAFEALPVSDRKAVQDALVWTGDYNGIDDGVFGKRTRDSILSYQANIKTPTTGIVDAAEIARLIATAQKAKDAIKFQIFIDDKTGVKIGAPLKILEKRIATGAGSRLAKSDGSISLDLAGVGGGDANLAALYTRFSADQPGRKIALKLSRPEFFVVSAEEGGRKIYSHYAKAPADAPDPNLIRGFTLSYPAPSADFDRIAVAIANSFDPFPAAPSPQAAVAPSPQAVAAPPAPAPAKAALSASGLLVASGQALSAIGAAECPHPAVDGKPGKYLREDEQSGLSLIAANVTAAAAGAAPILAPLSDDLVAITYALDEAAARPVLSVTAASPLAQAAGDGKPLLLASLGASAVGAPIFDRKGALVALVARATPAPRLIGGVSPSAPHPVIVAADIERFLSGADVAIGKPSDQAASSAGRIAAEKSALVVAITCN